MHESLNVGLAFIAGVASFVSPCILPLIPAYLSLMGGTTLVNLQGSRALRWSAVVNTAFFILGFTIVFVALGVLFSSAFGLLGRAVEIVNIIAGALVILLGVNFIFDFIGFLNMERRFQLSGKPTSRVGSLLFGMAFGGGWTPCIGPILGSILFLAGSQSSIVRGTILLLIYSVGLGVPFILTGLFLSPALRQMAKLRRHLGTIKVASGLFLVFIGILILLGQLKGFNAFAFAAANQLEAWATAHPAGARLVPAAIFAAIAVLIGGFYFARVRRDQSGALDVADRGGQGREDVSESMGAATVVDEPKQETGAAVRAMEAPAASIDTQTNAQVRAVRPARIVFLVIFVLLTALSASGVLRVIHLIASWLNFQGL